MPTKVLHREDEELHETEQLEIENRLAILRENETSGHYKCSHYLSPENRRTKAEVKVWRQWYIKWMFNVADHFRLGRSVVSYAVAYLDKFASEDHSILSSKDDFTVLAITSLYMAVKVYSTLVNASAICASNLVLLTEGKFIEEDIVRMERRMLDTLQWKLYPPTSVCFLREYIQLLPFDMTVISNLAELSYFIIEISVTKYTYVKYPPSAKAYAALSIALECLPETRRIARMLQQHEPFRYLQGLLTTWYPSLLDELRQSLTDRQPYQDLLTKLIGKAGHPDMVSTESDTGVDSKELLNSPHEPWWDSMLLDL
jgi:hypothetical protein